MSDERIERLCEIMHDAYEAAAVAQGWQTQERSRKPWADVPEANKATMRVAVAALVRVVETEERARLADFFDRVKALARDARS